MEGGGGGGSERAGTVTSGGRRAPRPPWPQHPAEPAGRHPQLGIGNRRGCGGGGVGWRGLRYPPVCVCRGAAPGGRLLPARTGAVLEGRSDGKAARGRAARPGNCPGGTGAKRGLEGGGETAPPNPSSSLLLLPLLFCEWAAAPLLRGEVPVSLTSVGERRSLKTFSLPASAHRLPLARIRGFPPRPGKRGEKKRKKIKAEGKENRALVGAGGQRL